MWYAAKQAEMKADPLSRYFSDLRTTIEKKASTPTAAFVHIISFGPQDFARLQPAPPGATAFFMGDQNGGSGWEVQKADGTIERYYVELDTDKAVTGIYLPDVPADIANGRPATELVREYLNRIEAVVNEAKARFVVESP